MTPFGRLKQHVSRRLVSPARVCALRVMDPTRQRFHCPICRYEGVFLDFAGVGGRRRHARCPRCRALERHRLQFLVLQRALEGRRLGDMDVLHFAPEACFEPILRSGARSYTSADLDGRGVDRRIDVTRIECPASSFDLVYASHVLEHVADDSAALAEIARVLRPGGFAVLPVPIVSDVTVEYGSPNPAEEWHRRAPGPDYYARYRRFFSRVDLFDSTAFPQVFQPFVYEDRTVYPTPRLPRRRPMPGEKHLDVVPVCYEPKGCH